MLIKHFSDIELSIVNGVLIDLDNTLYNYDINHHKALNSCFIKFSETYDLFSRYEDFQQHYRAKRAEVTLRLKGQGACRSRLLAFLTMFEELSISNAHVLALEFEDYYWSVFISNIEIYSEAYNFLCRCSDKNIPVCIVSDMQAHFQIQKIKKLGIAPLIKYLVTSEECGVEKPDAKIFQVSLKKMQVKPEQVIMIGDDFKKDIEGANALNITAFQINLAQ